ncbi:MAG: DMT family transporter [Clostridia bacterium]|nr:DMT family transporter [Clostridia bacterium]
MNKNLKGSLILVLAALVWGLAFVAQKDAASGIDLFAFTFSRSVITCVVLLPLCVYRMRKGADALPSLGAHIKTGSLMGLLLFGAIVAQQLGLNLGTSAGKSGFITALYIVIVPLFSMVVGHRYGKKIWLSVLLGLAGAALLSLDPTESFSMGLAEGVTLICAIIFSVHIVFIDHKTVGYDSCVLNAIQFGICGILGFFGMLIFEKPDMAQFTDNIGSILYVGAFSGAIGYTFQLIGQKYASPALASLIMCLESVFALLGGWLIGGEVLMYWEYIGCALLLSGCVIAQLPDKQISA